MGRDRVASGQMPFPKGTSAPSKKSQGCLIRERESDYQSRRPWTPPGRTCLGSWATASRVRVLVLKGTAKLPTGLLPLILRNPRRPCFHPICQPQFTTKKVTKTTQSIGHFQQFAQLQLQLPIRHIRSDTCSRSIPSLDPVIAYLSSLILSSISSSSDDLPRPSSHSSSLPNNSTSPFATPLPSLAFFIAL